MHLLEGFARERCCSVIYLNSKHATQFYRKLGYTETTPVETCHSQALLTKMSDVS